MKVWNRPEYTVNEENLTGPKLEEEWRKWATEQEICRIGLCLKVHDAELTQRFHHDPLLRHDLRWIPHACSSELFTAPSAKVWAKLYMENLQKEKEEEENDNDNDSNDNNDDNDDNDYDNNKDYNSMHSSRFPNYPLKSAEFSSYCALEGIGASVCEYVNLDDLDENAIADFTEDLIIWKNSFFGKCEKYYDPLCLMVLWHGIFVNIFANMDLIERATGRDGKEDSLQCVPLIKEWARSDNAKHCALHGVLLLKLLERMHLGSELSIHVPRCLYQALLSWYCYNKYAENRNLQSSFESHEIHSFSKSDLVQMYGVRDSRDLSLDIDMWTHFAHLLRRIEPWGISRILANNVLSLVESGEEEFL